MGIEGIHILYEVDDTASEKLEAAQASILVTEHRRGKHAGKTPIAECLLCQP